MSLRNLFRKKSGSSGSREIVVRHETRENDKENFPVALSNGDVAGGDLQAVTSRRHLSTDLFDANEESTKRFKNAGHKYMATKVVRRTTSMSRGDEKSMSESVMRYGESSMVEQHAAERSLQRSYHSSSKSKSLKEAHQTVSEYRDVANSLREWIKEETSYMMSDRNFPHSITEMRKIAQESHRFRTEEVPVKYEEKRRLKHIYRDLQKHYETVGEVDIEPELHINEIEHSWNQMIMAHQERDQLIHEEINRLEQLQKNPLSYVEEHTVSRQKVAMVETRQIDSSPYFKYLDECIEWCSKKLKQITEAEYGNDLPSAQAELNLHMREHNSIEQFHSRCEQCINAKYNLTGDELTEYTQNLNTLSSMYTDLLSTSNKRMSGLETLQDFLQSATNIMNWLKEKEEIEVTRDWSDTELNLANVEQYYRSLMSELDKREIQLNAVQDRGEALLLQNHPAAKTIDSYMTKLNNLWTWILQLMLALETHLKNSSYYQQFFKDVKEAEAWLNKRDEILNTKYSQSEFSLEEGERLLKGMHDLREELNEYAGVVESLAERAQKVVPLKQRRQPITRPIPIVAVCNYKKDSVSILKGNQWMLHDNSGRIKWRVSTGASDSDHNVPGVVFMIPPPDKDALEAIDRLKRQYERTLALWQRKQLRLRQNMIFSTIKVIKSWDLPHFLAMGPEKRNAIRKALNEDADKLLEEGDPSDPQLRRLRREVDEVNRLFDEFERRAREEEENKNAIKRFNDQISALQAILDDAEHTLNTRISSPIPRDVDSVEHLTVQHRDFETRLRSLTSDVDAVKSTFKSIQSKTPGLQSKLDRLMNTWDNLWNLCQLYKDRMKTVETVLKELNDVNHIISDYEIKLSSYRNMPTELDALKTVQKELVSLQNSARKHQTNIDQLMEDGRNTRRVVEKSRHHLHTTTHHDLDRLDSDLNKVAARWNNICSQLFDRLKGCEAAHAELERLANSYQDKLLPLLDWLSNAEKKVKDMSHMPTDEDKMQQRIKDHDVLHKDILRKRPAFNELIDAANNLRNLVGDEKAAGVADKMRDTADRYTNLVDASDNLGQLLQAQRAGLRHFMHLFNDLDSWMNNMNNRLNRYKVIPVEANKLLRHVEDLADMADEIMHRQGDVDRAVESGTDLMKHATKHDGAQLRNKLDSLQNRYRDLVSKSKDLLNAAQDKLPLVEQFYNLHNRLGDWMADAESQLQAFEPREEDMVQLEKEVKEYKPVLDKINVIGPQLCQLSPGEGAATIEGLVTRDNRRFKAIVDGIRHKVEQLHESKQRSRQVLSGLDELLDWFRDVENQLRDAELPSAEPDLIKMQLKEHKALNDSISSRKNQGRDVLAAAKNILRDSPYSEEMSFIREKMEDLKDIMEVVSRLSAERLSALEQAYALAEHFHASHADLSSWLDDMENQITMLAKPALRPDLIAQQQDKTEMFVHSVNEHKPIVEKLNKTGEALMKLVSPDDGARVQDILNSVNDRYAALRLELRKRLQALEDALQEASNLNDKLEGLLRALQNTADQVAGADPISAHPPRIRGQINENNALVDDLGNREDAFKAIKKAANDVINKAPNSNDPAVRDMKRKLDKLNNLWNELQKATNDRGRNLDEALALAEKFWDQLQAVMASLRNLEDLLHDQDPPAIQPAVIRQQQAALREIKAEMDQTKPNVEKCRATGQQLMKVVGDSEKPEVKKHIDDMDNAWDNVTALFAKREENLISAMEKAMDFHNTLQNILDFLDKAEKKFAKLGPVGSDIEAVKRQMQQLKQFKQEVDPFSVKVEALNRQAQELTSRTSADQAAALRKPLAEVNRRWNDLLSGIVDRQRELEDALLRLGQFQHALQELLQWIDATNRILDNDLKPLPGDPHVIDGDLAKLKVILNDIQANQSSVDSINDAGRMIIDSGRGTDEASSTQEKLVTLNNKWRDLSQKAVNRQGELEDALKESQRLAAEVQDLLSWLSEVDGVIAASKPTGGLPETARDQLDRFMEVFNELDDTRPKVESILAQGQEYVKKSPNSRASNLQRDLKALKQRWDSVNTRANDKKIKLEIALKDAIEFHDALQAFIDWLAGAERTLNNLKPVSRVLSTVLTQIEEHKVFQKDVSGHRETMSNLDKKGQHLKYFSQKQDVIQIKNLLLSVQHRWEKVVAKSAERTRALDSGYKEAKEFQDAWSDLMNWLGDTEKGLDELAEEAASLGNNPERIKQRIAKLREFQRGLGAKQSTYDATMRTGKTLKEKAPKTDEPQLRRMLNELKDKWNAVCAKAVDRQRQLEEALLFSGQFKDAFGALVDWLRRTEKELSEDTPVHGDLDTVNALIDLHKAFEEELHNRGAQLESVKQTANDLIREANAADAAALRTQLNEVDGLWNRVNKLSDRKNNRLLDALREAEELHKSVHSLLEWLSDAEVRLRQNAKLPESDDEAQAQLSDHEKFLRELADKEHDKDATINLAQRILEKAHSDAIPVIKHWINMIQQRWDEIANWAKQKRDKLRDHLRSLQDLDSLLEELLAWLQRCENQLLDAEAQTLPDDVPAVERLLEDHFRFMKSMADRTDDIDTVCKTKPTPLAATKKQSFIKKPSRLTPKDKSELVPHIGPRFPPKGSKSEPTFRNPRAKQLYDKWRNVWELAWERQRRLQERLKYAREMDKLRNFSWDDWRKRFLKHVDNKKSRVQDIFRKIDKKDYGLVPREGFIDGIMNTKFDTNRPEMNCVADMFDHDLAGLVDWKEFMAALRPDWEEKPATTEAEMIHDEVLRQANLCTCRQKFRVFQVGEGKYRFGDSQKLRLVRILRSTVMVRVGGGWVSLEEFLIKNDPCRAKGRTNIELREQFILADGVSQTMSAFRPKYHASKKDVDLSSNAGPITKIRVKSERSVPLSKTLNRNVCTPDSLSDTESPSGRSPVRSSSRSASRGGSKPASRHGSNLSLNSTDEDTTVQSKIPRRSTSVSRSSGSPQSRIPAWNGSLSSSSRSPTSPIPSSRLTRNPSAASDCSRKSTNTRTPTPIDLRAPFR